MFMSDCRKSCCARDKPDRVYASFSDESNYISAQMPCRTLLSSPRRGRWGDEMKRIRGDSDFLSIPRKGTNSDTPLRYPDSVEQVSTLWITLPRSGPAKRISRVGLAVSAVALFGCQKDSCFCSWTLWITTLILRIRLRPSGSAPIEQQGDQLLNTRCHPTVCWHSSRSAEGEGVAETIFPDIKNNKAFRQNRSFPYR